MPGGIPINGRVLTELRWLAGMEQLDLANAACAEHAACKLTPQNISAYEREETRPGAVNLDAIVRALRRGLARKGMEWDSLYLRLLIRTPTLDAATTSSSTAGEERPAKRRQANKIIGLAGFAAAMAPLEALGGAMATFDLTPATPGPVAPELVDYFRTQLADHYRADMAFGPRPLIATVVTQYWLIDELAEAATDDLRRGLLRLAVAYAALAGWLHQDIGDLALSSYWRSQALEMAHRCHDPQLVSYALTNKAMLRSDQGDGHGVIDFATAALADEPRLCPKMRVMAMVHAAHGHALLGERNACEHLLDAAGTLAERVDDDYPWGNACRRTPGYLDLQRATCYGRLGMATESLPLWDRLLTQPPGNSRRDYGVWRSRQAIAFASSREPEQAVVIALDVVPLVSQTGSARMHAELLILREAMAPWQHETSGRELDELLATITPSRPCQGSGEPRESR